MKFESDYENVKNYTELRDYCRDNIHDLIESESISHYDEKCQSLVDLMFDCVFNAGRNYQMDIDIERIKAKFDN